MYTHRMPHSTLHLFRRKPRNSAFGRCTTVRLRTVRALLNGRLHHDRRARTQLSYFSASLSWAVVDTAVLSNARGYSCFRTGYDIVYYAVVLTPFVCVECSIISHTAVWAFQPRPGTRLRRDANQLLPFPLVPSRIARPLQNIRPHVWYLVMSQCHPQNKPVQRMRIEVSAPTLCLQCHLNNTSMGRRVRGTMV